MRDLNLSEVVENQEFARVLPGGYICRIMSIDDVVDREYLKIEYDIAEGNFAGRYQELYNSRGFWGGNFIRSYKEKALPFFKGFITAVENSNKGFIFDNDESKLFGKIVGIVLGEEEYTKKDGSIGVRLYANQIRSVEQIRKGVEVPAMKRLKQDSGATQFGKEVFSDVDVPF
jgi:hypothetical protein